MVKMFNVKEDTLTTYLEEVEKLVLDSQKDITYKLADILVYSVEPRVDTGTLIESGFNEDNWFFHNKENLSILEIMYTGKDNEKRWTEFGFDPDNPTDTSQWRDYAYFQETGIDEEASKSDARRPHFIRDAINEQSDEIINRTQKYYNQLIKLQKI